MEEDDHAGDRGNQGASLRGQGGGDFRSQASALLDRSINEHQGRKRAGYASAGHRPTLSVGKARPIEERLNRLAQRHCGQCTADKACPEYTIAKALPPQGPFDEAHHPRWPKGTPLGGKFMSMDAEGFPMPPQIGSATNQEHQVQANGMYDAAKAGDWETLSKLAEKPNDKLFKLGGNIKIKPGASSPLDPGANLVWPTKETKGSAITTQDKWSMQKLQYAQALIDAKSNATNLTAKVDAITGPAGLSQYQKN